MSAGRWRVAVVDDHPLLAIGLADELRRAGFEPMVVDPSPRDEVAATIAAATPAGVLLDLGLPSVNAGLALLEALTALRLPVLIVTGETDTELWAACHERGAAAVVAKYEPAGDIVESVGRLCRGQIVRPHQGRQLSELSRKRRQDREERLAPFRGLSRREQEILAGLQRGQGAAELAARDVVSIETVRSHIKSVLHKLGVSSQLEAVARANAAEWEPTIGPARPVSAAR